MGKGKILLAALCLVFSGCASYNDLGGGRFERILDIQQPSAFGTAVVYSKLQNCEGRKNQYFPWLTDFSDCRDLTAWEKSSGGNWAPTIIEGALIGAGLGIGGALSGTTNIVNNAASSSSSASSSANALKKPHGYKQ